AQSGAEHVPWAEYRATAPGCGEKARCLVEGNQRPAARFEDFTAPQLSKRPAKLIGTGGSPHPLPPGGAPPPAPPPPHTPRHPPLRVARRAGGRRRYVIAKKPGFFEETGFLLGLSR